MKLYQLFILLFCITISDLANGQKMSYIGIEQGLSNNTVTAIHKDKFGLMWFGTNDGLNRFDGYNFKIFRNKYNDTTSLPNDVVTAISSDTAGNIWAGTQKGIGILNNKTFKFSRVYYKDVSGKIQVYSGWVNDLKKDTKGKIYVCSADIGLLIYKPGSNVAQQIPLIRHHKTTYQYTANAITVDKPNEMWLEVDNVGLCFYNTKSNTIEPVLISPDANCMISDHKETLWFGSKIGLYSYDIASHNLQRYPFKEDYLKTCWVTSLVIDKANCLWVTTDGEGMIKITGSNRQTYQLLKQGGPEGLSSNSEPVIYEDELSRKWIGTTLGGINIIDNKKDQFKTYANEPHNPNSLIDNFVFSFCEDAAKNVWIGTDGKGISIWHRKDNTFQNYTFKSHDVELNHNRIASIIRNNDQQIWVGSFGGGVLKYNVSSKTFESVPFLNNIPGGAVWKLYLDGNGDIWTTCLRGFNTIFGTERVFVYDKAKKAFVVPFSVDRDILSIVDDDKDNLWLGSFTSLIHASKKHGINKVIDIGVPVRSLYKSHAGRLWIGTFGRGLMSYDSRTGHFTDYTEENGLSNNKVLNIEEDSKGDIWVSTHNGLSRLNPATGKIANFYTADGLASNQFYYNASTRLSTGEMMFGSIKGFTIFNPDSIRQYNDYPPLLISGIRIANLPAAINNDFFPDADNLYTINKIKLPYSKAILTLDYVALEYSLPGKIQYAYFLQGHDQFWNYVGKQRSINYSQLNEGHYTLHIKCTNASGAWNPLEKVIDIVVLPPWYRSWWAYLLYIAILGASVYGYIWYHKKQTQMQYEVKLVKEVNEKKIAFFTNISHELRTPLTLIVNPIKELLQSNGTNMDLVDISAVYRNSRRLLSLVDQLLLFRSSENEIAALQPAWLNIRDVCYEVFLCFNNQIKAKNIDYRFKCPDEKLLLYADREKLEIVLFNLLSNAVKYTPAGGLVCLEVIDADEQVELLVKDSGHGIPAETGEQLFEKFYRLQQDHVHMESGFGIGLFLAKRYTEVHNGTLTYTSVVGEGTTFKMMLPKTKVDMVDSASPEVEHTANAASNPLLKELFIDDRLVSIIEVNEAESANKHVGELMDGIVNKKSIILLIDDDVEVRTYIKHLLKDEYIVYEADNSEAGFKIVAESEPDIIVCDVVMKGMSGVEFCSKLKESSSYSHIPVILLTGSSSPEIKLKGIECGADDYITKPFENDLLIARIKSMLKGRDTLKNYFFNEITLKNNTSKIPAEYSEFLHKCISIVEKHLEDESFTLKTLTDEIGMSRSKLFRKIKSISGLSSTEFIRYIRLRKAAELMVQTDLQIKEIAFKIGFQDVKHFREQFNKLFEMNPSEFIKKYRKTFIASYNLNTSIPQQKTRI